MRSALYCFLVVTRGGEETMGGIEGIMEIGIVNVFLDGDGFESKKRGGEWRLRSWNCSL